MSAAHTRPSGLRFRIASMGVGHRSEWFWGYAFISINVVFFLAFSLGPILASFGMAFTNWSLLKPPAFSGLANIRRLLDDPLFRISLGNSLYYVLGFVPLVTVLSFLLATLLNRGMRGVSLLRVAYFLPSMTILVSVAVVWNWMLDPQTGIINYALRSLGFLPPQWLADRHWAMPTLITIGVWQEVGYFAVIYLAGLQAIPATLYEAAEIDGASGWQKMIHITVPLIWPTTFFVLVTSLISGWQVFGLPLIMTRGGPANSTTTLLLYTYQQAFTSLRMGYAALLAWVLFVLIFIVTIIQWRLGKGGEHVLAQ